jgi:hypothetical protein
MGHSSQSPHRPQLVRRPVVRISRCVLEGVKSLSYLSVPENETKIDYEEKYTTAFATFYEEAKELSKLALHIVRPHDTIKV